MENKWIWPLPGCDMILHTKPHPGGFGVIRKHDIHTGMDLYCQPEQKVVAVEDGEVVVIEEFTGSKSNPPTPWWEDTQAVLIEGASGVVVYGEIKPIEGLRAGQKVKQGEIIGHVSTVLKKDKGLPMTMLHIELYKPGTRETVIWSLNEPKPDNLLDPTMKLVFLK